MMEKITQIAITITIIILSIKLFLKGYKDYKSDFEKTLYIMLSFAIALPLIIYYLDRYDIPSKLGYTKNINSSDWVSMLINYSASIISTLLSAVFLIFVTFKQIEETHKDNMKLNNETLRIQNLPLLRYNFISRNQEEMSDENKTFIFSRKDDKNSDSIEFIMEIENIGLNTARKVYLEINSELFNKRKFFELCNQSNIEKNQVKRKKFIIENVKKGTYKIEITVYYQDLLKVWYKQKVYLTISMTGIYDSKTNNCCQINSFTINDEEMLIKEPKIIKNEK